jgi:hypothetical protein
MSSSSITDRVPGDQVWWDSYRDRVDRVAQEASGMDPFRFAAVGLPDRA